MAKITPLQAVMSRMKTPTKGGVVARVAPSPAGRGWKAASPVATGRLAPPKSTMPPAVEQMLTAGMGLPIASSPPGSVIGAGMIQAPSIDFLTGGDRLPNQIGIPSGYPAAEQTPSAQTGAQAIISAASGGAVLPTVGAPSQSFLTGGGKTTTVAQEVPGPSAPGGAGPLLLGAGAGFLVGGPVGAVVGAIAGSIAGRKAQAASEEPLPAAGWAAIDAVAFGGIGSFLKKTVRKVGSAIDPRNVKKAIGFVAAPIIAPSAFLLKGTTAAARAAHIPGAKSADNFVGSAYRSDLVTSARYGSGVLALVGAAAVGGIAAAPVVGSLGTSLGITGVGAATAGGKIVSGLLKGPPAAEQTIAVQPAGAKGAAALGPIAGLGIGFLAGGPIGALVGGAAGWFLGRSGSIPQPPTTTVAVNGYGFGAYGIVRTKPRTTPPIVARRPPSFLPTRRGTLYRQSWR
jgi:hypothetical protein